jgi:hypothetical protein
VIVKPHNEAALARWGLLCRWKKECGFWHTWRYKALEFAVEVNISESVSACLLEKTLASLLMLLLGGNCLPFLQI